MHKSTLSPNVFAALKSKVPFGQRSFAALRRSGQIYVDKTELIAQLARDCGPGLNRPLLSFHPRCFVKALVLARPRGFGKSLLLSTLAELFRYGTKEHDGKSSCFAGLNIEKLWDNNANPPGSFCVLELDFARLECRDEHEFVRSLCAQLRAQLQQSHFKLKMPRNDSLNGLFAAVNTLPQGSLVLLIDNADAPAFKWINASNQLQASRVGAELRFFFVLCRFFLRPEVLRFFLLTTCRAPLLFELCPADFVCDLSRLPQYQELCGFSRAELERCFASQLAFAARQRQILKWLEGKSAAALDTFSEDLPAQLEQWYGGYSFDISGQSRLLNPFSVQSFLCDERFELKPRCFSALIKHDLLRAGLLRPFAARFLGQVMLNRFKLQKARFMQQRPGLFEWHNLMAVRAEAGAANGDLLELQLPSHEIVQGIKELYGRYLLKVSPSFGRKIIERWVKALRHAKDQLSGETPLMDAFNEFCIYISLQRYKFRSYRDHLSLCELILGLGCGIEIDAEVVPSGADQLEPASLCWHFEGKKFYLEFNVMPRKLKTKSWLYLSDRTFDSNFRRWQSGLRYLQQENIYIRFINDYGSSRAVAGFINWYPDWYAGMSAGQIAQIKAAKAAKQEA